jgi:hypothetical protein
MVLPVDVVSHVVKLILPLLKNTILKDGTIQIA